jgi:hypothetical protein
VKDRAEREGVVALKSPPDRGSAAPVSAVSDSCSKQALYSISEDSYAALSSVCSFEASSLFVVEGMLDILVPSSNTYGVKKLSSLLYFGGFILVAAAWPLFV